MTKKGEVFLKDYKVQNQNITVTMGTKPQLQTAVTGIMSDDSTQEGTITWNLTDEMYNTPGEKELKGTLKVGNEEVAVSAKPSCKTDHRSSTELHKSNRKKSGSDPAFNCSRYPSGWHKLWCICSYLGVYQSNGSGKRRRCCKSKR